MSSLYIVIPAYNESANIERTIDQWYPVVERHNDEGKSRLVIINDGKASAISSSRVIRTGSADAADSRSSCGAAISMGGNCLNCRKGRNFYPFRYYFRRLGLFILRNRKYWLSLLSTPSSKFMKKTCFLLLTVLLTTAALRASAQNKDTSKENFPSTETTLSQIGQAEAHPNARHVRMADTSALAAPVKRPGLIRRIIDYYSRSNVDRTFEKKIDWSIAPGPNYSSDVGFGIGFLLAGLYRLDRTDSVTAPSNISIYGNFTTEKFVLLRFSGDNIYNHNKQRLSYSGAFVYFPGAFYGVGYNAGKEGYAQDLTTTMGAFRISYCTSLVGRFYIGVSGGIDYSGAKYKNSGMADRMNGIQADVESGKPVPGGKMGELYNLWQEGRYDPAKQDPFSNYIATTGDKPNAFNANVGLFAQYDTRDVTFNASKGIFIKAEAKWYPEWLGNTRRTFGRFTLTFDFYQKLWKGAVLACDLYADATTGTPSWHMYAKMGGMERMRGYYEGRYRDKKLVETQIELRQKIYRRHGIVGWIGGGQVWGTEKFRWGNTLCSFGCGYRFEFKNRMNIRLDYGWGNFGNQNLPWDRKRSSAFLFTASEAF